MARGFRDYPNSKGELNKVISEAIVINEIESNGSDNDWVEITILPTTILILQADIKDDSLDHFSVKLPQNDLARERIFRL